MFGRPPRPSPGPETRCAGRVAPPAKVAVSNLTTWFRPVVTLSANPTTFVGILLTTTGGVAWLFLLPVSFGGGPGHPYLGLLFFLILPLIFFSGLVLIPVGIVLRRGKFRRRGGYPDEFPPVNWANPAFRQLSIFVALATTANVVIGGHYTYSAVDYMDSVSFCGESCHVMTPEFTAYKMSPHAQVACVDCHVGEGPASFVLAKLNGVSQLVGVATGSHSRPIPTPVHNLRPANETCGKCHSAGHRCLLMPGRFPSTRPTKGRRGWSAFVRLCQRTDHTHWLSSTCACRRVGTGLKRLNTSGERMRTWR